MPTLVTGKVSSSGNSNGAKLVETQAQKVTKQLSSFTPKVKDTLLKINLEIKKLAWSSQQFFEKVDVNKNGVCEKGEFIQFFAKDLQVKGVSVPADIEQIFEALDMNKD